MADDEIPAADDAVAHDTAAVMVRLAAEHGAGLDERPGVSGTVVVTVTGTPAGDRSVAIDWLDGRIVRASSGTPPDPSLTLTIGADDGASMLAGNLEPSVAYMRGRLKTSGDNGLVLGVLEAVAAGDTFLSWASAVRSAARPAS